MIELENLKELKKVAIEYLNEKKDKLADEYDHLIFFSIFDVNNKFPSLNIFYNNEGRSFLSLLPGKPSKYMSTLYPQKIYNKDIDFLKNEYLNLAKKYNKKLNVNINMGICQSPFVIPSYYINGNESLIKRYILSEKIKGIKYISLYKEIDEKLLDFILDSYNSWYYEGIFLYYTSNEIHLVFEIPEKYENKSLIIELGKLAKTYIMKNNVFLLDSYKIPDMNIKFPVLMVLKSKVWDLKEFNIQEVYDEILNKINESYLCITNVFK
ncbi:hypothetical protein JCM30566_01620 [Marinitoga arctica]